MNQESKIIPITGLWKKTDKNGNTYLSGPLSNRTRLLIFQNLKKQGEKEPDYYISIAESNREGQPQSQGNSYKQNNAADDMPF